MFIILVFLQSFISKFEKTRLQSFKRPVLVWSISSLCPVLRLDFQALRVPIMQLSQPNFMCRVHTESARSLCKVHAFLRRLARCKGTFQSTFLGTSALPQVLLTELTCGLSSDVFCSSSNDFPTPGCFDEPL